MSLPIQERISQLVAEIEVEKDHDRLTKLDLKIAISRMKFESEPARSDQPPGYSAET